ncbi:M48 family metallopeptidase [Aliidiomarina sp. Khilg15.8]
MKQITLGVGVALLISACSTSPTGRSQLNLMSSSQLNTMGAQSFQQMKEEQKVSDDPAANAYVQCLADAIIEVLPQEYALDSWEVVVFDSEQVNAFALPGGYIGIYTGMIRLAENQHQLAAVMGHEVGHVMAEHSNERVSNNLLVSAGLLGADFALSDRSPQQRALIMAGLGIGAQIGYTLPYSRVHESEADEIGLDLMAKAGFDPHEAPKLWENMQAMAGGGGPPELLSTHPSPGSRIKDLNAQIPSVMSDYEARLEQGAGPQCERPAWADEEPAEES